MLEMRVCRAGCTLCALNEVEAAKQEFAAALAIMPRHLEVRCGSPRDKLVLLATFDWPHSATAIQGKTCCLWEALPLVQELAICWVVDAL